jgi:hypothetical protein
VSAAIDWSVIPEDNGAGCRIVAVCAACGQQWVYVNPNYRGGCPKCNGVIVHRPGTHTDDAGDGSHI